MTGLFSLLFRPYRQPWNRAALWVDGFVWGACATAVTLSILFLDGYMGDLPSAVLLVFGLVVSAGAKLVLAGLQVFPRFRRTTSDPYAARMRALSGLQYGLAGLLVGVLRSTLPAWEGLRSAALLAGSLLAIFVYLKAGYKIVQRLIDKNTPKSAA